ncbi:MAG: methyltransferase domain-containing protein [bacterium]
MFKNFLTICADIWRSIQKRGLKDTVLLIFYEFYFDFRYRSETLKMIELTDLDDVKSSKANSERYQATPYYFLRKPLLRIRDEVKGSYFLDYGCGKGRALLLAAELGARAVYGVDFSEKLCKICEENLKRYGRIKDYFVECNDAVAYQLPDHVNVIYFCNPFNNVLLEKILKQIKASLDKNKRKMIIIYFNPIYESMFYDIGFRRAERITQRNWEDHIAILRN